MYFAEVKISTNWVGIWLDKKKIIVDPTRNGAIEIRKLPKNGILEVSCSTKPPVLENNFISFTLAKVIRQRIRCDSSWIMMPGNKKE